MRSFSYLFTPALLIPILRPNYSWDTRPVSGILVMFHRLFMIFGDNLGRFVY